MMQVLANELNCFCIFTPTLELPMAEHPTIGTAYALAANGTVKTEEGRNEQVFEEGVGDIPLTVYKEGNIIAKVEMEQPLAEFGERSTDVEAAQLLSLSKYEER